MTVNRNKENRHIYDHWKLVRNHYYDFYVGSDVHPFPLDNKYDENCISISINANIQDSIEQDLTTHSVVQWIDAVNTGVVAPDWGICSIDNGYTPVNWENDLYDIMTNTTLTIDDLMFYAKPVAGNFYCHPPLDYSLTYTGEGYKYFQAKGGWLQGFYKLYFPNHVEIQYQTSFNRVKKACTYEFVLKPDTEQFKENTLNSIFPDNAGIFFYQGTRAENKMWYYSRKVNVENIQKIKNAVIQNGACTPLIDYFDPVFLSAAKTVFESLTTSAGIELGKSNFVEIETDNKYLYFSRSCNGYTVDDDYPEKVLIQYQKKRTDLNYHLLFNRTPWGLDVDKAEKANPSHTCYPRYYSEMLHYYSNVPFTTSVELNKNIPNDVVDTTPFNGWVAMPEVLTYPILNNIKPAGTEYKDTTTEVGVEQDLDLYDNTIDIFSDIYNNALAFLIRPDGSIGYRILVKNDDSERRCASPTKIVEEYSQSGVVKSDCWHHVVVKITYKTELEETECNFSDSRDGIIAFYIDGSLKFTTTFKEPIFHELNENYSKQEGVPYNISFMGGTQGLLETVLSDNPLDYERYVFPLERHFAGSLHGDFMIANISQCNMSLNDIQKRYKEFKSLYHLLKWC